MDEFSRTIRYLFIMGILLMILAYYVGATGLLKTIFSGVNTLDLTATGRDQQGNFGAYPKVQ